MARKLAGVRHSICRYPILVEHRSFPSSSHRWTVEGIWGTLWNARCIFRPIKLTGVPLRFFSQDPEVRERELTKGRVIGGLDGLFVRRTRWLLPSRGFGPSALWLHRSCICSAKGPSVVSGILIAQPTARGRIYARSHTHVWFMRLTVGIYRFAVSELAGG